MIRIQSSIAGHRVACRVASPSAHIRRYIRGYNQRSRCGVADFLFFPITQTIINRALCLVGAG